MALSRPILLLGVPTTTTLRVLSGGRDIRQSGTTYAGHRARRTRQESLARKGHVPHLWVRVFLVLSQAVSLFTCAGSLPRAARASPRFQRRQQLLYIPPT